MHRFGVRAFDVSRSTPRTTRIALTALIVLGVASAVPARAMARRADSAAEDVAGGAGPDIEYRFAYANRADQELMPQYGYNLIDVATKNEADAVPAGTLAQVWLGNYDNTTCSWKVDDATISARVSAMADDPKVAGFYFAADSDPLKCPSAIQQHKDRNALIKSLAASKYTIVGVDSNWRAHFAAQVALWKGVADYLAYNPYICHLDAACDFAWLDTVLQAAEANGNPYFVALQAFADGSQWRWPTADEERQMLERLENPNLSLLRGYMTFSWNWKNDPLLNHPDVLQAIKDFNLGTSTTPADSVAPTTPTGVTVTNATPTMISLSWGASLDNVGVAGYDLFQDGTKIATTADTTYSVAGLSCGTSYTLGVEAYDAAGNHSARATITAATSACPDDEPPSAPTDLTTTATTEASVSVSWSPSSDNVAVAGYDVYLDGSKVATTGSTSYAFSGLVCGTSYTFGVEASDAAGNHSARSTLTAAAKACASGAAPRIEYRFAYANRADQELMPQYGYNLIDVATKNEADAVPAGTLAQVWVGDYDNTTCSWKVDDATISARVSAMADDPKVAGFYFANESDPIKCPSAIQQHKDRNALIKSLAPSKYTILAVDSNWRAHFATQVPLWKGVADYLAYNPYVCFLGKPCDFAWLDTVLQAAQANGNPYFVALQAFAEGSQWRWPTADEEQQMLERLENPNLTLLRGYMTFSWNWKNDPLLNHPDVLQAIKDFNLGTGTPPADTVAPTAPGNLTVTASTQTSLSLSWSAPFDNVGVAGYDLFQDGTKIATTADTTYSVAGLSCGTSYTLGVDAYDAAGNHSAIVSVSGTTTACSAPAPTDPVIVAAGDICATPTDCAPTALLIDQIAPTRVLALGDNAYQDGTGSQYASYYDPNWGRFKAKTSPTPGNHDYHTAGAGGYFAYFGSQAPAAYYSYDLGSWHLISLNGEIGIAADSAQETWLKNDLAAHPAKCTLAYWHEPRFSSGAVHGSYPKFDPFWRDLYAAGVDVVLNGHDHEYERFAPQNPSGVADPNGIREFVVGTGGASHYSFGTALANSEIRDRTSYGVLKLTLHPGSYDWKFVPIAGASFTDSDSTSCH